MEILQIIGQIIFGGFFIFNGINHLTKTSALTAYASSKNVPSPKIVVIITGLMILLGGLGVLIGMYTTLSLWLIIIFLLGVSFVMHNFWAVPAEQKQAEMTNFTKNMALVGAALMLL